MLADHPNRLYSCWVVTGAYWLRTGCPLRLCPVLYLQAKWRGRSAARVKPIYPRGGYRRGASWRRSHVSLWFYAVARRRGRLLVGWLADRKRAQTLLGDDKRRFVALLPEAPCVLPCYEIGLRCRYCAYWLLPACHDGTGAAGDV